jgi:serine/threonine protein phosphatase PrpC
MLEIREPSRQPLLAGSMSRGEVSPERVSILPLTNSEPMIEATPLNRDHKPELKDEADRIHKRGGRIDSFRDYYNNGEPIGPQRVWLQNEEIPGLAMSRSMGDKVAHSVGVTAEPETLEFTLGLNDKFLVIASDGVWEFLSNEDVANIVFPFYE